MFEIKTAFSYIIPRRNQLSLSIVGLIAVLVIQAIVWLILVFFSTTEGIERNWSEKISGVLGPIHLIPTPEYYSSPLYQIDICSHKTGHEPLRISKKAQYTDFAWDAEIDAPLPIPLKQWNENTPSPKNSIARLTSVLTQEKIPFRFFESTVSHLVFPHLSANPEASVSVYSCLLGYKKIDLNSFVGVDGMSPSELEALLDELSQDAQCKNFLAFTSIFSFSAIATENLSNDISKGTICTGTIDPENGAIVTLISPNGKALKIPLSTTPRQFTVTEVKTSSPPLLLSKDGLLAYHKTKGYPILLPKQMRQQGARLFDTGYFESPSIHPSSSKPTLFPVYIAGFFDSGILPIGGKVCITPLHLVTAIDPSLSSQSPLHPSGITIDVPLSDVPKMKEKLSVIAKDVTGSLFIAQDFKHFDTTKELYQQLTSEKTLFRLISCIIIAVACANIFSMLFILAHDRRKEIAILRALGTSKLRIIIIFSLAGILVGLFGAILGSTLASLTLLKLPQILSFIANIQGQELLNQNIYGTIGSQKISVHTLLFTYISISAAAGISGFIAAIRACTAHISEALKG